jgi:hypothetical protein
MFSVFPEKTVLIIMCQTESVKSPQHIIDVCTVSALYSRRLLAASYCCLVVQSQNFTEMMPNV